VQLEREDAPAGDVLLTGQAVHAVAPADGVYVLGGHVMAADAADAWT
jgi:hypothetical protein